MLPLRQKIEYCRTRSSRLSSSQVPKGSFLPFTRTQKNRTFLQPSTHIEEAAYDTYLSVPVTAFAVNLQLVTLPTAFARADEDVPKIDKD